MEKNPKSYSLYDFLDKDLGKTVSLATMYGTILLFIYSKSNNISFPVSSGQLGVLVLALTLVSLLILSLYIFVAVMPWIIKSAIEQADYARLYNNKSVWNKKNFKIYLGTSGIFLLLPSLGVFIGAIVDIPYLHYVTFILATLSTSGYAWQRLKQPDVTQSRFGTLVFVFLINVSSVYWMFMVLIVIAGIADPQTPMIWFYIVYPLLMFLFLILNYIYVFPYHDTPLKNWLTPSISKIIAGIMTSVPIVIPPIGNHIATKSLHLLGLGGNHRVVYEIALTKISDIPKALLNASENNRTIVLNLVLDKGIVKEVRAKNDHRVYQILSNTIVAYQLIKQ